MVVAWLEVECLMPMYTQMCYDNIKSGKLLLELKDSELEAGLGITSAMHRWKLRLAIEEYRDPTAMYVQKKKQHHSKVLPNSISMNGHILGFCPYNQKLGNFVSTKVSHWESKG